MAFVLSLERRRCHDNTQDRLQPGPEDGQLKCGCDRYRLDHAKNVPGRETDVSDVRLLRRLHSYGLLRGSFCPEAEIAILRAHTRQRERLTVYAAADIQHMSEALMEMNLQLHHVVSDITAATGMRITRAIVAG